MPIRVNREQVVAMVSHSGSRAFAARKAPADGSGTGSPVPALCGVRAFRTRPVSPCALAGPFARR